MAEPIQIEAFVRLFHLNDTNSDGTFSKEDTLEPLLSEAAYDYFDSMDGVAGNGFNRATIARFIDDAGFQGLSRFYPSYAFSYSSACRCVEVGLSGAALVQGTIPSTDPRVVQTVLQAGLPKGFPDKSGGRVIAAAVGKSKRTVIAIEDQHQDSAHARLIVGTAEGLLARRPRLVLLYESLGDRPVTTTKDMEILWGLTRKILGDIAEAQRQGVPLVLPPDISRIPQAVEWVKSLVAVWNSLKGEKRQPETIEFKDLKDLLEKNRAFKEALSATSPILVLKALYGDRIVVANSESLEPVNGYLTGGKAVRESGQTTSDEDPVLTEFAATFSAIERVRQERGHAGDSFLLRPEIREKAERYYRRIDERTERWVMNLESLFADPKMNFGGSPLVLVVGGGLHMPHFAERVGVKDSLLVLRPNH